MPTIDITKTVNNLAGVTGLSFTATAVQGTNTYPLTVTYNHPNLNLKSSGSVGTSGDFTFNIQASFVKDSVNCTKSISFTEQISNLITNVQWYGNLALPNQTTPFANDNVGSNNGLFGATLGNGLIGVTLLPGNDEAIFEFYYARLSNNITAWDGNSIRFGSTDKREMFGIAHGSTNGWTNIPFQFVASVIGTPEYILDVNFPVYHRYVMTFLRNATGTVTFGGCCMNNEKITIGESDFTYAGMLTTPYPKTLFKFRMINGNFEWYKDNVLLGTLPYDNTKSYKIGIINFNYYSGLNNSLIQLVRIEGNFAPY